MAKNEISKLSLLRSDKKPLAPVGSFYDVLNNNYIQITDNKGFVNVDTHILMFGKVGNKMPSNNLYRHPLTECLKEIGF
tara:strand:- start:233 stop:469 length:237 start_codon:yes stop_codon:yes gene_type:complete